MDTNSERFQLAHLLRTLSILTILLFFSCVSQPRGPSDNIDVRTVDGSTKVLREFIRRAYAQDVSIIKKDGIDIEAISEVLSNNYRSRLLLLSEAYKKKKRSFSDFESESLERIFSSETNFLILHPWSYQPVASSVRVTDGDANIAPSQLTARFDEIRWNDSTPQELIVYLVTENGKPKVNDIRWSGAESHETVASRLTKVTKALEEAGTLDEFEKGVAEAL